VPIELDDETCEGPLKPVEAASAAAKVCQLLSGNEGKQNGAAFDGFMMSKLNPLASDIVKACLPGGLAVPFPTNVSHYCDVFDCLAYTSHIFHFARLLELWLQQVPRVQL
jgi:hypothetical protein